MLSATLTEHRRYEKNPLKKSSNARNDYFTKPLLSDDGEVELKTPRDRKGSFEPHRY
ncbi:hypothetical protein FA822_18535 [Escherichia coli]|nr:hypothetical protein [Escherichia coli]EFD4961526.1 hypothetical protein [Escherichia coli]